MIITKVSSDSIAEAEGITVTIGSPVLALCRKLVEAGHDPATPMQVYRGDTLCLTVRSIGEAAELEVVGGRFTRVQKRCLGSPVSLTAPSTLAA